MQNVEISGELKEFIEVLKLLEKMDEIKSVDIKIMNIPLGRKFSYLNDGVTRRRCLLCKIKKINGYTYLLIEIERIKHFLNWC